MVEVTHTLVGFAIHHGFATVHARKGRIAIRRGIFTVRSARKGVYVHVPFTFVFVFCH